MALHSQGRRGRSARSLMRVLVASVTAAALMGLSCSAGEKKAAEDTATRVLLPKVSKGLRYVAETHPSGGTLSEVAAGLATAIDSGQSIKAQLDRIAASDDPYGQALVTATCYGLSNIADQSRQNDGNVLPATAQAWERFLNHEVGVLLPLKLASAIASRVTQFNNAAQLATINPRVAYVYVDQCALRRK